ncbi:MAG: hypothetical protein V3U54_12340 [Thermodesulfobacteriota bacterium]
MIHYYTAIKTLLSINVYFGVQIAFLRLIKEDKMKKVIMKSLLVFTTLVFTVTSAMAAKPEDVIDKLNVFPSGKKYAMNITVKSGKGKEATAITELQTVDPRTPEFNVDDATMEQLRMILLLMCVPGFWQSIPTNIQLR